MGCAQGKPSSNSQSNRLEKLKRENGYLPREGFVGHRRSTGQMLNNNNKADSILKNQINGGFGSGRKDSHRPLLVDEDDDLVNGWPKWLINNVPSEVLAGLTPKSAENYDKIDKVGQGTYSNVYKALDRDTGKIVALKKVKFDTSEPESVKFMAREIMVLQKLDHPNVVKLEGLATSRMQYSLYLVFDFMQSDLATIITRPDGRLTEPQVKCYMHQLLSGLQHCHERGILHRDIKGSNLLIDKNGMLKIADFGLANYYSRGNNNNKCPLTSRVVTLWYRAPELLLGATDYGVGIDLWSAGCLLAEMFTGRPIMPGRNEVDQLHRIFKLCGTPSEDYWKKLRLSTTFRPPKVSKTSLFASFGGLLPESALALLSTLLALDPAYRGSASSAINNVFFNTSPLACDLSNLPVIWREEDELAQANELRKHRNSKKKRKSKSYNYERRRKDLIDEAEKQKEDSTLPKEETKNIERPNIQSQEPARSSTSTGSSSSGTKLLKGQAEDTPISSYYNKQKTSPRNVQLGLPPLPAAAYYKSSSSRYNNNDIIYRLNEVNRSASTTEFRNFNRRNHVQLFVMDN